MLPILGDKPIVSEFRARQRRRVLFVFPRYAPSFGTFQHSYRLLPGVRAFMPPQGPLLIAASLPAGWDVRFVDENLTPATERDYAWADCVFISGMHVQRPAILEINARAHRHGKVTVLGGPSVSGCPGYYPEVDILHVGEMGDATVALFRRLDESVARPPEQLILRTEERLPLDAYPKPAYHLLNLRRYFIGSVQFSSGCPFMCEFCDIPALYGRKPRLKRPAQVVAELDTMLAAGLRSAVYFVDDNFIANPAAARDLLPHLVEWQKRVGYRLTLCCEATLNLAQHPDILALMQQANFGTVFVGIETPEPDALLAMHKTQNSRQPIVEAVQTINRFGMEVVSGIILGLDTDTAQTGDRILQFIDASKIPMLTINLLYALPRTKLYDRLASAGRLVDDPARLSNVAFRMPYEQVVAMWRKTIGAAYEPEALLERFAYQTRHTFPNRLHPTPAKVSADMVAFGLQAMARTLWHVGVRGTWRKEFWKIAGPLLKQKRVDEVMHIAVVGHHLIRFARESQKDHAEAAFYADPSRGEAVLATA